MGPEKVIYNPDLQVISHRGHPSHFPENTLQGFLSAISVGADAVEMDLVISADKKVVLSHEPYMAAATVLTPEGKTIGRGREKDHNLYKMSYDRIKQYKVGLKGGGDYEHQKKIESHKPLLQEVLQTTETYRKKNGLLPVTYYLEVKSRPSDYGIFQPHPEEFADLVMKAVIECEMEDAVVIKSFDAGFLNALKKKYPKIKTSYLLYRTGWQEGLERLEHKPEIISPYHKQLESKEQVEELQERGFKVIPWTVNNRRRIKEIINLGVDGIISDYPERVIELNQKSTD